MDPLDTSYDDIEVVNEMPDLDIEIFEPEPAPISEDVEIIEESQSSEPSYEEAVEITEGDDSFKSEELVTEWENGDDLVNHAFAQARKVPTVFANSRNSMIRAFAYLENLSEEIIEGVQQDAPYADLTETQLTTLDVIEEGIESALRDISAAINGNPRISKVATKSSNFRTYINPFIFGLARTLINGKISQGKNIESLASTLDGKYKLDDREKLELYYALEDMGHPIRSSFVDNEDMATQYHT